MSDKVMIAFASLVLLCCQFGGISAAARPATFRQNGRAIERSADTNTQEDFHPERERLEDSKRDLSGKLHIHVLPHSHDDPGWVRTADQYFEFFVNPMYTTAVEALMKNPERKFQVVEIVYFQKWYLLATEEIKKQAHVLVKNGQFNFAVGGWVMPDEATVDYPDLINTMSMGHEWLYDTFDGVRVRHGFQVDPFGASSAFAAFSAKFGFESHLVARLNYYDKGWMQNNKQLEFVWRPSPSLYASPEKTEIFTHIMDQYQYSAPGIPVNVQIDALCAPPHNRTDCPGGGFYWDGDDGHPDSYWADQWKELGYAVYPGVNASNVDFYADFLVNNSISRTKWFATNNLLWPFGTDFQHFNATAMFDSMDRVIRHITSNNNPGQRYAGIDITYSSLGDYVAAVKTAKPASWPVRGGGDFLPYSTLNCNGIASGSLPACSGNAGPQLNVSWPQTWSGFFTSHAKLKIQAREAARDLRAGGQLGAVAFLSKTANMSKSSTLTTTAAVKTLRSAVGLVPHHDALSGTMGSGCGNDPAKGYPDIHTCEALPMGKPGDSGAVADDYANRMQNGKETVNRQTAKAASGLLGGAANLGVDPARFYAALAAGKDASVVVHNPLGWDTVEWVRVGLPGDLNGKGFEVFTSEGTRIPSDTLPPGALECLGEGAKALCDAADSTTLMKLKSNGGKGGSLYFRAKVPAMGLAAFVVRPRAARRMGVEVNELRDAVVRTKFFSLTFEGGVLTTVGDEEGGVSLPMEQRLWEYESFSHVENITAEDPTSWTLTYTGSRSGSYLLHPSTLEPVAVSHAFKTPKLTIVEGAHVTEVRQWFSPTHSQVWRLYTQETDPIAAGYLELQMGVGPLEGNRELVAKFDTKGAIPTDPNGHGSEFYSDSNGFQLQRRVFSGVRTFPDGSRQNVSPDPSYTLALSLYPVVRSAHIRGDGKQLTVLTQQTGAVTSTESGTLSVMVHRRSLQDDSKGACQVFNDTTGDYASIPIDTSEGTTCTQFGWAGTCRPDNCPTFAVPMNISTRVEPLMWILPGQRSTSESRWRQLSQRLNNKPSLIYTDTPILKKSPVAPLGPGASGLPKEIHLLSLQPRKSDMSELVLRLQHIAEMEAATAEENGPVKVDFAQAGLCNLLGENAYVEERELNSLPFGTSEGVLTVSTNDTVRLDALGSRGGAEAAEVEKLVGGDDDRRERRGSKKAVPACEFSTSIWPQDIKTFLVTFE